MKKSAQYKILPELKIMIEYFSVETTLNDMILFKPVKPVFLNLTELRK